ncbi:MAG TPA: hypothetical protein VGF34_04780 [Stellaceae bacterium]|jgi:hypothetical protein
MTENSAGRRGDLILVRAVPDELQSLVGDVVQQWLARHAFGHAGQLSIVLLMDPAEDATERMRSYVGCDKARFLIHLPELLPALRRVCGTMGWTAADAVQQSRNDAKLGRVIDAIVAGDDDPAREFGMWLARAKDIEVAGLVLRRGRLCGGYRRWRVATA